MFPDILIHINGSKSLKIENYKNILDYKENFIFLQGKVQNVKISGKEFRIDYFTKESMHVSGVLEKIEFEKTGNHHNRR